MQKYTNVYLKKEEIYKIAYRILGDKTPLAGKDCGKLCGGACCEGDDETGMYLYPFEDVMFSKKDSWYRIITSDFTYDNEKVDILTCPGMCNRNERPLACRIFPLAPFRKGKKDKLSIIIDPRSFSLCPLSQREYVKMMDSNFYHRVECVFRFLNQFDPIARFIEEMSFQMDDYRRFYIDDGKKK